MIFTDDLVLGSLFRFIKDGKALGPTASINRLSAFDNPVRSKKDDNAQEESKEPQLNSSGRNPTNLESIDAAQMRIISL